MLSESRIEEIKKRKDAATPGPWLNGWENEHGAGCTGPELAALTDIDDSSRLAMVCQPNAIRQSENPKHWYGRGVARIASKDDAEFIAHSITDVSDLLDEREEMVRKTAKRCLEIVNAEHLEHDSDETESESDEAYNAALEDIANLIRREFELPVAPEGK